MKILFIGETDRLASAILERLRKEDHDIFFLSEDPTAGENKAFGRYHTYTRTESREEMGRVFASAAPDVVIYEGIGFLYETWREEQRENLKQLSFALEECSMQEKCRFLFLSSLEAGTAENTEQKALLLLQEENMIQIYHTKKGMPAVILRLGTLYDGTITVGGRDWLGELAGQLQREGEWTKAEQKRQPVHILDAADAVVRVLEENRQLLYHVCGTEQVLESEAAEMLAENMGLSLEVHPAGMEKEPPYYSNALLKQEKEWTQFWTWRRMTEEKRFICEQEKKQSKKERKKRVLGSEIRKTLENIVLFSVFCLAFFGTKEHSLFSQMDWLLIYVVVISLAYGVKQSTLAVVLAGGAYMVSQGTNLMEMTNFYSYAGSVLMIVEFLFFGVVVGYSADMLREEVQRYRRKLTKRARGYEKLKEINEKNVQIKKEYEKRLLDAKTSLPRLYTMFQRIAVTDTERIFAEILYVVRELLQTDTAAIYRVTKDSSYARLMASLNSRSLLEGNSLDLEKYPGIQQALEQNVFYEGDVWKKEPAIVLPICSSGGCEAMIVVKTLSMETHSLYSVNVLRTFMTMASDFIDKALQYEALSREQRYYRDTDILYPKEFKKALAFAEEKREKGIADCCLIRLQAGADWMQLYGKAKKAFRERDIWGSDEEGNLYVLLGNTNPKEAKKVLERLGSLGIHAGKAENVS